MAEFEELRLTITLVDNATAGIKAMRVELRAVEADSNRFRQKMQELTRDNKEFSTNLNQVNAKTALLAAAAGYAGSKIDELQQKVYEQLTVLSRFSREVQQINNAAKLLGISFGRLQHIIEQGAQFGLNEATTKNITASLIALQAQLKRKAGIDAFRARMESDKDIKLDPQHLEGLIDRLRSAADEGEILAAIQDSALQVERSEFDRTQDAELARKAKAQWITKLGLPEQLLLFKKIDKTTEEYLAQQKSVLVAAEGWNAQLGELQKNLTSIRDTFALNAMSIHGPFYKTLKLTQIASEFVRDNLKRWLATLKKIVTGPGTIIKKGLEGLGKNPGAGQLPPELFKPRKQSLQTEQLDELTDEIRKVNEILRPTGPRIVPAALSPSGGAPTGGGTAGGGGLFGGAGAFRGLMPGGGGGTPGGGGGRQAALPPSGGPGGAPPGGGGPRGPSTPRAPGGGPPVSPPAPPPGVPAPGVPSAPAPVIPGSGTGGAPFSPGRMRDPRAPGGGGPGGAQAPGGPGPSFSPGVNAAIDKAAADAGVSPGMLRAFAQIESGGNPNSVTGSYQGLFQLSNEEFNKHGGGNIFNAADNARAAANKLKAEAGQFENKFGRPPEEHELYMIHQQGWGGFQKHLENPDQPAWQSMYQTGEGQRKGEGWAKKAIWGNLPAEAKKRFGSVENVTSRDFTNWWKERYARARGGPGTPLGDPNAGFAEGGFTSIPKPGGYNRADISTLRAALDRGLEPGTPAAAAPPAISLPQTPEGIPAISRASPSGAYAPQGGDVTRPGDFEPGGAGREYGAGRGNRLHSGVDTRYPNATPLHAKVGGTVLYVGNNQGYGANVVIRGDDGTIRRYATHGTIEKNLKPGARIGAGEKIGNIGDIGTGPHLHEETIEPTLPGGKSNPKYQEFIDNARSNTFTSTSGQAGTTSPRDVAARQEALTQARQSGGLNSLLGKTPALPPPDEVKEGGSSPAYNKPGGYSKVDRSFLDKQMGNKIQLPKADGEGKVSIKVTEPKDVGGTPKDLFKEDKAERQENMTPSKTGPEVQVTGGSGDGDDKGPSVEAD